LPREERLGVVAAGQQLEAKPVMHLFKGLGKGDAAQLGIHPRDGIDFTGAAAALQVALAQGGGLMHGRSVAQPEGSAAMLPAARSVDQRSHPQLEAEV